jgi:hypothetical protein
MGAGNCRNRVGKGAARERKGVASGSDSSLPVPEPLLVAIQDQWIAIVPDETRKHVNPIETVFLSQGGDPQGFPQTRR